MTVASEFRQLRSLLGSIDEPVDTLMACAKLTSHNATLPERSNAVAAPFRWLAIQMLFAAHAVRKGVDEARAVLAPKGALDATVASVREWGS